MLTTSASLLQRLRQPQQGDAWARFVALYTPLLLIWAHKAGLTADDASDHVQDVFVDLVQELPKFMYDRERGKFRCWLYTLFHNKIRDRFRRKRVVVGQANDAELASLAASADPNAFTEEEHLQYIVRRVLEVMKADFEPTTWQACWEYVANDLPAKTVAQRLGISENAVFSAKARVLRRVREELPEFLE